MTLEPRRTKSVSGLRPCAVVVGSGHRDGLGGALCARIAREGLPVYAVGRNAEKLASLVASIPEEEGDITPVVADISAPEAITELFAKVEEAGHRPELVIFNAAERNLPKGLLEMTPAYLEQLWRVCYLGGVYVGQQAIQQMLPQGHGTLIFTGASASLRGKARFGAFAAVKAALRNHAQAMAREFGPKGIHVAHVVVDGIVNGNRAARFGFGLGKAYLMAKGDDGSLLPDAVAEAYWQLHRQHRSAWTQELDLRPFKETF